MFIKKAKNKEYTNKEEYSVDSKDTEISVENTDEAKKQDTQNTDENTDENVDTSKEKEVEPKKESIFDQVKKLRQQSKDEFNKKLAEFTAEDAELVAQASDLRKQAKEIQDKIREKEIKNIEEVRDILVDEVNNSTEIDESQKAAKIASIVKEADDEKTKRAADKDELDEDFIETTAEENERLEETNFETDKMKNRLHKLEEALQRDEQERLRLAYVNKKENKKKYTKEQKKARPELLNNTARQSYSREAEELRIRIARAEELSNLIHDQQSLRTNLKKKAIPDDKFGPILKYIKNENITDINWNGSELWIDDLNEGRYIAPEKLDEKWIAQFSSHVSNLVSQSFNKYNPLLEAETEDLRVSILHEDRLATNRSISIRKTPAIKRINFMDSIQNGEYTTVEIANLISNAVKAKFNVVVCGIPGVGKTELVKYLTSYIPATDRVITIEDNLEIHYREINPGKDCVSIKIDDVFDYTAAIKACLRQFPSWIMMAEARSKEVKYLMEAMSTGTHCLTTIHAEDVRELPNRIKTMAGDALLAQQMVEDVYSNIDMAIMIDKKIEPANEEETKFKITRRIAQVATFDRSNNENTIRLLVDNGERTGEVMQDKLLMKMKLRGIKDPFKYTFIKY